MSELTQSPLTISVITEDPVHILILHETGFNEHRSWPSQSDTQFINLQVFMSQSGPLCSCGRLKLASCVDRLVSGKN